MEKQLPVTPPLPLKPYRKDRRSGAALVMAALSLIVLVPMLGLAIDGANVYLMRNQMNVAMEAAVLAATRSLNVGQTIDQQSAAATAVADSVFNADTGAIPGMTMDPLGTQTSQTAGPLFTVTQNNTTHYRTVTGSLSADLRLAFMGMMNLPTAHVNITVAATRRDVNIVMVLDNGSGMGLVGGDTSVGTPLATLQTDAVAFVNVFANGRDNIGLVTFTSAPFVADALPNQNFLSNVPNNINTLTAAGQGGPNTSAGLEAAYQQLQNLNQPGALNVIVLFTDGIPTGFSGDFGSLLKSGQSICAPTGGHVNGVIWNLPDGSGQPNGLSEPTTTGENYDASSQTAPSCPGGVVPRMANLLTGIPSVDLLNNATIGSYPNAPVNLSSLSTQNIIYASENALDAAAATIRSDTALLPVIFVIGLNGNPVLQPDPILMAKIANDPSSSYYNSRQPAGQSIIAPSTAQLQSAFSAIASQVLRLAAGH